MRAPLHVVDDRMVGRRPEIDALRTWLKGAADGAGRIVLCAGEPGIGKTRLAQELAGTALARGTAVVWGRCIEAEGAPAFWPWRQVLRSLGAGVDGLLAGDVESSDDRFRLFDDVTQVVCGAAGSNGLLIILDDIHWADEASLLLLGHLAGQIVDAPVLVFATFRDAGMPSAGALTRLVPELLRSPRAQRLDLSGFSVTEVGEQLSVLTGGGPAADAGVVLDVTGGNPLFVREVARAMADGTWRFDRPPRTVLDVVIARLDRVSAGCRRFVQAAAIVGRDVNIALVAAVLDEPLARCLPLVDEAIAHRLLYRADDGGDYRFVHALTRDAVEASLATADRAALHRAAAEAMEKHFGGSLSEHVAGIARHWAAVAPYGEAATARVWATRAADDAVHRLAYEEGARLYRAALGFEGETLADIERYRLLVALGRACYLAGDLAGSVDAASAAAEVARATRRSELIAGAALVLEAASDTRVNAVAQELCEEALAGLGDTGGEALRGQLLSQLSHLAYYAGDQQRVESLSAMALDVARASADDRALSAALRARKEACPGPAGRAERLDLAAEMLALAKRTNSARGAMWGHLWRIDGLVESGELSMAAEELARLRVAVEHAGGPVSAWHRDRVSAFVAQAQGRYAEAATLGRQAFDRMRMVEPRPARGAYFSLLCALARHAGISEEATEFLHHRFEPLPQFTTIGRVSRAFLFLQAGRRDEAAMSYDEAGPVDTWSLPPFFFLFAYVYGVLVCAELDRRRDLEMLVGRLEAFRGAHATGEGVVYLGPVDLTLGRGAASLGRIDGAIEHLEAAAQQAGRAGAAGFLAEARYHLAVVLAARGRAGDRQEAEMSARAAERLARSLGMTPYIERSAALVEQLGDSGGRGVLSQRESEVAKLVAGGLTNRQIAARLFISERTAQNHVQHILTKLGFTARSQIAAWSVRSNE